MERKADSKPSSLDAKKPAPVRCWISPIDGSDRLIAESEVRGFCSEVLGCTVRDYRHHVGEIVGKGESEHVNGWQLLEKVQWLAHSRTTEYVPVLGGVDHFMLNVAVHRKDMAFSAQRLATQLEFVRTYAPTNSMQRIIGSWNIVSAPDNATFWLKMVCIPPGKKKTDLLRKEIAPDGQRVWKKVLKVEHDPGAEFMTITVDGGDKWSKVAPRAGRKEGCCLFVLKATLTALLGLLALWLSSYAWTFWGALLKLYDKGLGPATSFHRNADSFQAFHFLAHGFTFTTCAIALWVTVVWTTISTLSTLGSMLRDIFSGRREQPYAELPDPEAAAPAEKESSAR